MYFAACQLRENMGQDHESMYRTALRRVYEIARFRETQLRVHGPAAGTAQAVFHAYERVKTAGKLQPYSLSAIDSSLTIMARLLCIPSVQNRLLDADAWDRGSNPFDSVYKLEARLRKGKDTAGITWLMEMIRYVVQHKSKPSESDDLSVQGLKGKKTNGNRGYADVLLFKRDCLPYLLDNLPQELGLYPVWFTSVRWTMLSHTWTSLKGSGALASGTMTYYVNFLPLIYMRSHIRQLHQGPRQNTPSKQVAFPYNLASLLSAA
jgi:hypothetical protein